MLGAIAMALAPSTAKCEVVPSPSSRFGAWRPQPPPPRTRPKSQSPVKSPSITGDASLLTTKSLCRYSREDFVVKPSELFLKTCRVLVEPHRTRGG